MGGFALCPAALSSTAMLSMNMIFGHVADICFFGSAVRGLPLLGGALLLLSSALMVYAQKRAKRATKDAQHKLEAQQTESDATFSSTDDSTDSSTDEEGGSST